MPNAKDAKIGSEKILAVGGGGGGKTAGFLTLPGKKYAFLFDQSALNTIKGHNIDYSQYLPDSISIDAVSLKKDIRDKITANIEPMTYIAFETQFQAMLESGTFAEYDAILFDSMTTFQDIVMDRIMWLNGRLGKWPEQPDWTATMNTVTNVLRTLTSISNATIYVTAHIEFKQDETTSRMQNILSLIGRLRNKLPLLFSEIWQFSADTDAQGQTHFYVQTKPDRYSPYLRSTIQGLQTQEDVTIPDWSKPEGSGIGAILNRSK